VDVQAVTDQDVADEKRKSKKRKQERADAKDDKIPMDAVEFPGIDTAGSDVSARVVGDGNHQNLSPTDSFGDVEMATKVLSRSDSESITVESHREFRDTVNALRYSSTTVLQGDSVPAFDSASERLHQDSGCVSEVDNDSNPGMERNVDECESHGSCEIGESALLRTISSNVGSPHANDRECSDDDDYSPGNLPVLPSVDSFGGATASFEGVWGEAPSVSYSSGILGLGMQQHFNGSDGMDPSSFQSSDDEGSDCENIDSCRKALFRTDPMDDGIAVGEQEMSVRSRDTASSEDERKEEMDASRNSDVPSLEQAPSTDSYGNYCEYITPPNLHLPIAMTKRESFATAASEYTYDDDSTGDNVCPICLSGYKKGDMLVVSKHCTHCFHKDCILEWLDKHDECPICRVNMVTNLELSRAATSLVGKTRMYRAVATMAPSGIARYRTQQSPSSVVSGPSPLGATVRSRSAAATRTPPRGYQNPRAFS
jgi:Ring finger domain